jgi:prepilin-type N-terminal cleavage/methylation domain-containing protein
MRSVIAIRRPAYSVGEKSDEALKGVSAENESNESGFTLIETVFALVIILIALLGVVHSFTYAILYNMGNATRTQCVALLQKQVEEIRAKKWTTNGIDAALASGTTVQHVPSINGGQFSITTTVDDDPFTDGVQADTTSNLKEITIIVKLDAPSPGWQTAIPANVVMRRTKGN